MESIVSVKDFIIDIPKVVNEVKGKRKSIQSSKEHQFEVILENNIDFVLNRKTSTTDKSLVFLISQRQFYLKNNKNNDVEILSEQRLRNFFTQIYYCELDMFEKCEWIKNKRPENIISLMMAIVKNEDMQLMYKHGICVDEMDFRSWCESFKANIKLFRYCYGKIKDSIINKSYFNYILNFATYVYNEIDFNNAKFLIDRIAESNMKMSLYYNNYGTNHYKVFIDTSKEHNLNLNRFIEYTIEDLYSQGIDKLDYDVLSLYRDYLNMQVGLYGKVKEKYPKHLKTDHDIIALKYNTYKRYKQDLMVFNVAEHYKELIYKTKEYSVILPETSVDIVEEGIQQSSCVGSYVDKVTKNESMILFMRKTDEIDKSLVTIEVNNGAVVQVKGFANRDINKNEEIFLKKWAKDKKLKYELN